MNDSSNGIVFVGLSLASQVAQMSTADRFVFTSSLSPAEMNALRWDWKFWARPEQLEPDPASLPEKQRNWSVWLVMAGRGFGKTRLGAEWVKSQVIGKTPLSPGKCHRIAIVAETAADARDVMVQGPSGILAVHQPEFRPVYKKSQRVIEWANGARALLFSADEPDQLRGPEHDLAWCDETAKWQYADDTWNMLQFGMRVGEHPRQLVTTTPRPIKIVRDLLDGEKTGRTLVTRGSTFDNVDNLAPSFIQQIREKYDNTRLGRQELYAELLDDVPGAIWTRENLSRRTNENPTGAGMGPSETRPEMQRVVIGVDPSGSSGEDDSGDDIGIIVAGKGVDGLYYVLRDATCNLGPSGWANVVKDMYEGWRADLVVAERNFGGAMVEANIRTVHRRINYKNVTAARGKVVRAEPIASLYEQGRVRHVASFADLEDQMLGMTRDGYLGRGSPDRVDALVWALSELSDGPSREASATTVEGHFASWKRR
jgi:phage terminase large subunit-like protein